ncbi:MULTISPECIES: PGPGW domain-containing protein [Corallincola]|uniref:Tellurium resistance protein TerC n=3 Tax=Corallincola TaxID=1775176 RepID=A0A368NSE2_9GAMM|nr:MULTISPECIES: PGPGW domain-containing protein [Corallincola]RCU52745.1 hypothetical protein DU002_01925 [Corallincola holothuriorum]TAA48074.1 hypothetical protein EXY25_02195 [Corallincola spongiicola]TCI03245.1 hypothetical protein EZV61_10205 [Corallincola luteus]
MMKKVLLTITGVTLILLGAALIITPVPGILFMIIGLACLSLVYERPKSLLRLLQAKLHHGARRIDKRRMQKKLYR